MSTALAVYPSLSSSSQTTVIPTLGNLMPSGSESTCIQMDIPSHTDTHATTTTILTTGIKTFLKSFYICLLVLFITTLNNKCVHSIKI